MENLTEYRIKLPTLPDGFEIVGIGKLEPGDIRLCIEADGRSHWGAGSLGFTYPIIARRRETLAGWANKQRLFQAFAEIFRLRAGGQLKHIGNADWMYDAEFMQRQVVNLEVPPANLTGKLRLESGKWVDAT